jgi:hypothetical protein
MSKKGIREKYTRKFPYRNGPYTVIGRAIDGVKILEPKTKPAHFTREEMRKTVDKVVRDYYRSKR